MKKITVLFCHLIFILIFFKFIHWIQMFSLLADVFAAPKNISVGAQMVISRNEGEELTVRCLFNFVGISKVFCKEPCNEDNTLLWLPGTGTIGGPLSFQFTESQTNNKVSVTFRRLTKADSALYFCGLIGVYTRSTQQVRIVVNGEFPSSVLTVIRGYGGLSIAALQCPAGGITANSKQFHF